MLIGDWIVWIVVCVYICQSWDTLSTCAGCTGFEPLKQLCRWVGSWARLLSWLLVLTIVGHSQWDSINVKGSSWWHVSKIWRLSVSSLSTLTVELGRTLVWGNCTFVNRIKTLKNKSYIANYFAQSQQFSFKAGILPWASDNDKCMYVWLSNVK